jgi:hypothetical protein
MTMKAIRGVMMAASLALLAGCGPRFDIGPEGDVGSNRKVTVDGYMFDAKIRRNGKPTSVRLQFYETDDVIGMSGRGYLGKGALKVRLTDDSLIAYFPATHEYVREAMPELFASNECASRTAPPPLKRLLATLPSPEMYPVAVFTVTKEEKKKHEYEIDWIDCPWRMSLTYDLRDEGWRLKKMRFEVDSEERFSMKRRTFKPDIKVKQSKLRLRVPDGAVRVSL